MKDKSFRITEIDVKKDGYMIEISKDDYAGSLEKLELRKGS